MSDRVGLRYETAPDGEITAIELVELSSCGDVGDLVARVERDDPIWKLIYVLLVDYVDAREYFSVAEFVSGDPPPKAWRVDTSELDGIGYAAVLAVYNERCRE